jgi:hypothetical protein
MTTAPAGSDGGAAPATDTVEKGSEPAGEVPTAPAATGDRGILSSPSTHESIETLPVKLRVVGWQKMAVTPWGSAEGFFAKLEAGEIGADLVRQAWVDCVVDSSSVLRVFRTEEERVQAAEEDVKTLPLGPGYYLFWIPVGGNEGFARECNAAAANQIDNGVYVSSLDDLKVLAQSPNAKFIGDRLVTSWSQRELTNLPSVPSGTFAPALPPGSLSPLR